MMKTGICLRMMILFVMVIHKGMGQSILPDDYAYDTNGNMVSDLNKEITRIHYNILNLPDTVAYADGRKIVYMYTATGQKIRQRVLDAAGAATVQRDYVGSLLYENGTLQQMQHEEGRVILGPGHPEYQYHLKDHLGNVRMTVTSSEETTEYLATMEREKAEGEEQQFSNMGPRLPYPSANHTVDGKAVLSVAAGTERSAGFGLAVNKGDVVYLEVYAYYENGTDHEDKSESPALKQAMATVVSSVGAIGGGLLSGEVSGLLSSPVSMLLPSPEGGEEQVPSAHLNYSLFDKHYTMITGGYRPVTKGAGQAQELLTLGPLEIEQSGYLDVYLSNTSVGQRVYFDDLKVTHIAGPVVQEDSYDPFGLVLSGQHGVRYGEPENRYLYNGKEQQTDHDLNWYDYGARMYDATLGRWHVHDPLAEKYASWSPYQYTLNNPVKFIDPDGRDIEPFMPKKNDRGINIRFLCALILLSTTHEGSRIWQDVAANKNVSVYIAPHEGRMKFGETVAVGVTRVEDWESPVMSFPAGDPFKLFDGLNVSKDLAQGKDVYLVLVSVDEILQLLSIAGITAHELDAHINIPYRDQATIEKLLKNPDLTDAERDALQGSIEHSLYGDNSGYDMFLGGRVVTFNGASPRRGSTAERMSRQLAEVYKQLQRIKELQAREALKKKP
jgi:RHS repeat-associated protein